MRDHPYELFTSPLKDILFRLMLYVLTIYAAGIMVCWPFALFVEGRIDVMLLAITPILPLALIAAGVQQGFGLISYVILAFVGLLFISTQMRYRWLGLAFAIQFVEALRLLYSEWASI